jgi:hypothetical protein
MASRRSGCSSRPGWSSATAASSTYAWPTLTGSSAAPGPLTYARHQLGGRWPWDGTLGDALKTADPTVVADVVGRLRAAGFRELATFQLPEELLDDS